MKELIYTSLRFLDKSKFILISALIGSLTGALIMLIFAPQSGKQTRDQIQKKSISLLDYLKAD